MRKGSWGSALMGRYGPARPMQEIKWDGSADGGSDRIGAIGRMAVAKRGINGPQSLRVGSGARGAQDALGQGTVIEDEANAGKQGGISAGQAVGGEKPRGQGPQERADARLRFDSECG